MAPPPVVRPCMLCCGVGISGDDKKVVGMMSGQLIPYMLLVVACVIASFGWKHTIRALERTEEENVNLQDTIFGLNKRLEKACEERDEALQNYENLRHSWPYLEPASQPRVPGQWPPEYWCSVKRPDFPSEGMMM